VEHTGQTGGSYIAAGNYFGGAFSSQGQRIYEFTGNLPFLQLFKDCSGGRVVAFPGITGKNKDFDENLLLYNRLKI
jgi:hypothetical protein